MVCDGSRNSFGDGIGRLPLRQRRIKAGISLAELARRSVANVAPATSALGT